MRATARGLRGTALSPLLLALGASLASAGPWQETQKLPGTWVALAPSGDLALAGDGHAGEVSVYRRDGTAWVEEQRLEPSGGEWIGPGAIEGEVALVIAGAEDILRDSGAAYVFRYDGTQWLEEQRLLPSDAQGLLFFGYPAALEGDVALIGARGFGPVDTPWGTFFVSSRFYLFRFDGGQWVEEYRDIFDTDSVDLAGDTAVVGNGSEALLLRHDGVEWVPLRSFMGGAEAVAVGPGVVLAGDPGDDVVRVHRFDGSTWVEDAPLAPDDASPHVGRFGSRVALVGERALVADSRDGELGDLAGAAYTFRFDGLRWVREQKLLASDGAEGDLFGQAASFADGVALLAANRDDEPGPVYAFENRGPSVQLKVGGDPAAYPASVVTTPGRVELTLDMEAGSDELDHYLFAWVEETFYWLTTEGPQEDPAPIGTFTPADVEGLPLLDVDFPAGLWVFGWIMAESGTPVTWDFIVVDVAP